MFRDNDEEGIKRIAEILPRCIRVLDQIGWQDSGAESQYRLDVDDDLLRLVVDIRPHINHTIRDDLDYLEGADAGERTQGERLLALDREALAGLISSKWRLRDGDRAHLAPGRPARRVRGASNGGSSEGFHGCCRRRRRSICSCNAASRPVIAHRERIIQKASAAAREEQR